MAAYDILEFAIVWNKYKSHVVMENITTKSSTRFRRG
jgi:hypothetical protein